MSNLRLKAVQTLWQLFTTGITDWSGQVLRIAGQHGLTMSEVNTLYEVSASGPLNVSEIARRTGLSKAAASQLVERMVRDGLLSRQESPHSRREKLVSPTPEGKKITLSFDESMLEEMHKTLSTVPDDTIERLHSALKETLTHVGKDR